MSAGVKGLGTRERALSVNDEALPMHSLGSVSSILARAAAEQGQAGHVGQGGQGGQAGPSTLTIPLSTQSIDGDQHRRSPEASKRYPRPKSIASRSLLEALYPSASAAPTIPSAGDNINTDIGQEGSASGSDMSAPQTLKEQVHAIFSGDGRGSYGPISLFSPPGTRRSSTNDETDDLEAGAPVGLVSYVTSKRRQARQGRWIAFIIFAGGIAYFAINNMMINDWLRARVQGMSDKFDPAWAAATSKVHIGAGEWLGAGVRIIPDDPSHVLVPTSGSSRSSPIELLQSFKRLHSPSLIEFYSTGQISTLPTSDIPYPTVDFIYTFVNASSPYLQSAMTVKREQEGLPPSDRGASKHWRDNGEIRGSVRSSIQALGRNLNKVHLIAADFELDSQSGLAGDEGRQALAKQGKGKDAWKEEWKAGQVPVWLNTDADQERLQWHFHSEIFRLPADDGALDTRVRNTFKTEKAWKNLATPSFSSFPIESRIGWVHDLNENFVYSNDDMFLTSPLELTDYHHPILGPVIRVAGGSSLAISGNLTPDLISSPGEWGGLEHAGLLLKNRFTPRRRNYMMHMPKAMTKSMVHEASVMFAPQLSLAATRTFRISKRGEADVHFAWLTSQLRIERWREALLWSWAVARLGGQDGRWDVQAQQEVLDLFGIKGNGDEDTMVWFKQEPRETVPDMEQIMEDQGWEFPLASDYVFSSMDGHIPEPGVSYESPRSCGIVPSQCFPALFSPRARVDGVDAEEAFKNITFDNYKCGDCLIIGLVAQSGPRGLSAILPTEEQTFRPDSTREKQMWDRSEPMLPLVSRWAEGNFTAANVVRQGQDLWEGSDASEKDLVGRQEGLVKLRDWCVKLLSRYIYSLADSPSLFVMTHNGREMEKVLKDIDSHEEVAMACINDDQPDGSDGAAGEKLGHWMEGRFGAWEAGWEKEDWAWVKESA